MKKLIIILAFIVVGFHGLKAQQVIYAPVHHAYSDFVRESAVSVGLGMGGNSPFGAEMQLMLVPRLSAQLGVGFSGFSGGINYHLFPTVRSPYFSMQVWQQGYGNNYKASFAGPMFVYRAPLLFQAGIGVGYAFDVNPAVQLDSKLNLMFNLGIYLPML